MTVFKKALLFFVVLYSFPISLRADLDSKVNWTVDPVVLPDGRESVYYSVNLNQYVNNPEKAPLVFKGEGLSPWLTLDPHGTLSGVPTKEHIGNSNAKVTVSTCCESSTATIMLKVFSSESSVTWSFNPIDLGAQKVDQLFEFDLNSVVSNPKELKLKFAAQGLPNWVTLKSEGVLTGTPRKDDIGNYDDIQFTLESVEGVLSANAFGVVEKNNNEISSGPRWLKNPFDLGTACLGKPFISPIDFSTFVENGSRPLIFSAIQLPRWLNFDSEGLSGTPTTEDLGQNSFHLKVADMQGEDFTLVKITVVDCK